MTGKINLQGLGVPWFTEVEWAKAKHVMADGNTFHKTYAEWRQNAERVINGLQRGGTPVVRINIDVEAFCSWCAVHGAEVNSQSRARFAALEAKRLDGG